MWTRGRDKYGRSTQALSDDATMRMLGVVTTLPKAYAAKYGHTHMASDWTTIRGYDDTPAKVTLHTSMKAAKAHLVSVTS